MPELNEIRRQAQEAEREQDFQRAAALWHDLAVRGEASPRELKDQCNLTLFNVWLRHGGALYQDDDLDGAREVWERLRDEDPTQQVLRSLTFVYLSLGRLEEGRATGEAFLANDREDPEVWKIMGRIYAGLAEKALRGRREPLPYWHLAIDALNEVLIAFNPLDEVAIEWKARCVDGIEGHFMPELERRLDQFLSLVRQEEFDAAHEVIYDILPRMVEHVADLQTKDPVKSQRTARGFLDLLQREARLADIDLEVAFSGVIAQMDVLIMWACHAVGDHRGADDALLDARGHAHKRTLPFVAQAQLQFARGQKDAVEAPLEQARSLVVTEHDKYLIAQACYALGQFTDAVEWAESVDTELLRDQVYRPDRSLAAFRRFMAEVHELAECHDDLHWEDLSPESIQLIIRRLLGDTSIE